MADIDAKALLDIPISLGLVAVVSIIGAILLMLPVKGIYTYCVASFQRKKKLQQAKDAGHVVEAWCTNRRNPRGIPEPTDRYFATYSYKFEGKEYKRRFKYLSEPPTRLTMYFVKKPSKAEPENSFIGMEAGLFPFYISSVIILFVLMLVVFGGKIF